MNKDIALLLKKINTLERKLLKLSNSESRFPQVPKKKKPLVKLDKKSRSYENKFDPSSKLAARNELIKGMINPAKETLAKVYTHVFDGSTGPFIECVEEACGFFNHLIRHRGLKEGTKRFKDVRLYTIKTLLGIPVEHVPCLSTYKDGFPKDIRSVRRHFKDHPEYVRIVNTIMSISRLTSSINKLIDTESITRQPNRTSEFKLEVANFETALPGIFAKLGIRIDANARELIGDKIKLHYTAKNGPNSQGRGLDALESAHIDAFAVTNDELVSYNLQKYLQLVDRTDFWNYITDLSQSFTPDGIAVTCSKLVAIEQPENKQRVIAELDYFSQAALLPLHHYLTKVTTSVPNSYVFDQNKGRELVKEFTSDPTAQPQSEDASNWTDRFPMELQESVLKTLFNKEFARSCRRLLTDRRFTVQGQKDSVMYGAGQPMGAFPSFSLANLTHSLYIYWKLSKHGEDPVKDSAVCGDDVAFRRLSKGYQEYVSGITHLGVQFNPTKGFSSPNSDLRIAEFCKRLYLNGKDLSPLSPKVASLSGRDFKYAGLLYNVVRDDQHFEQWIAKYDDKVARRASQLYRLPKFISGIDRKIDFSDESSYSVFGFAPDMDFRSKYNVLMNVCLFELFMFAIGESEKRLNSFYEPSLAQGPPSQTRLDHLKELPERWKPSPYSRIHGPWDDESNDKRVLDFSSYVKSAVPLISKGTIHPLLCVIRNTLIPTQKYAGEQAALLYFPSQKIQQYIDLYELRESDWLSKAVDYCLRLINNPNDSESSRQLMQRESVWETRDCENSFVVGSRVLSRLNSFITEREKSKNESPLVFKVISASFDFK